MMPKKIQCWVIASCLFVVLTHIQRKTAIGECNTDCRHHTVFYIDEGSGGIVCRQYATADCYYCSILGQCDDSIPKSLNSHCDDDPCLPQKSRNVNKCTLKCDLKVGRGAHATVEQPKGEFKDDGYVYHCQ